MAKTKASAAGRQNVSRGAWNVPEPSEKLPLCHVTAAVTSFPPRRLAISARAAGLARAITWRPWASRKGERAPGRIFCKRRSALLRAEHCRVSANACILQGFQDRLHVPFQIFAIAQQHKEFFMVGEGAEDGERLMQRVFKVGAAAAHCLSAGAPQELSYKVVVAGGGREQARLAGNHRQAHLLIGVVAQHVLSQQLGPCQPVGAHVQGQHRIGDVEQQQPWIPGQGPSQTDPLLLSARQLSRVAVAVLVGAN